MEVLLKVEDTEEVFSPCLLCSSPGYPLPDDTPLLAASSSSSSKGVGVLKDDDDCPRLNTSLWSVFVLRKLLAFPKAEVVQLLRGMGGVSPGDWYYLCDSCSLLAFQTMELTQQLLELQGKIEKRRNEAVGKLRASILAENSGGALEGGESSTSTGVVSARDTVRKYFREHFGKPQPQPSSFSLSSFLEVNLESGDDEDDFGNFPDNENDMDYEDDLEGDSDDEDPAFIPKSAKRAAKANKKASEEKTPGGSKKRQRVSVTSANGTKCPVCKKYILPANLPGHLKRHEQRQNQQCRLCDFNTKFKKEFIRHMKESHNEDDTGGGTFHFSCDKCDYTCSTQTSKNNHLQKHKIKESVVTSSSGELSCKLCGLVVENMFKINLHLREAHGAELGLQAYQCPHCPKSCTSSQLLNFHISSKHQGGYKYSCDLCGYGCLGPPQLRDHIAAVHNSTGKKEFICDICGNGYFTNTALRSHRKRNHEGSRSIKEVQREWRRNQNKACQVCSFVATNHPALITHRKAEHPELFPMQCSKCPHRFMKIHHLVKHEQLFHAQ